MRKIYLSLFVISLLFTATAQLTVTGIVTAADSKKPLKDVLVQVKDGDFFVTTDKEGSYMVTFAGSGAYNITSTQQIPDELLESPTLIFALDGFETIEKRVERSGQLDVELPFLSLANVAQSAKEANPTSDIGVVGGHQLLQPYIGSALNGKIAGVQTFSEDMRAVLFRLRSNNALANSTQPLIVMDDIWLTENDWIDLTPEDIAHIEVLKGASSAALYGSRGGNGVIRIQTKRGNQRAKGSSRINLRTEYGFSQPNNRYDLNTLTHRAILSANGAQPVLGEVNESGQFNESLPSLRDYQEEILFQNGSFQSHYLSIENRSFNTNFMASVHRMEDVGILQFSEGYIRNALRFNLDHQINDKWSFHATTAYTFAEEELVGQSEKETLASTLLLTPIFDLNVPNEENASPYDWDIDNTGNGIINPLYLSANTDRRLNHNRLLGNWGIDYQFRPFLRFQYSTRLDRVTRNETFFIEKGFLSSVVPEPFGAQTIFGIDGSKGGAIRENRQVQQQFLSQADVVFEKKLLGIETTAGLTYQYESSLLESDSQQGENLSVAGLRSLDNPQHNILISSNEQFDLSHNGMAFIRANFKDKYQFDGVVRQERSSLFGEMVNNDYFYRTGISYLVSKDLKIKGVQEFRLHASTGTAGIRPRFEQRFSDFQLRNGQVTKNILENPNLRPILVEEIEVGGSIRFARAIRLEGSYSQNTAEDQILLMPLSGGTGFEGQWQNAGTLSNKSYEASLDLNIAELFRVKWSGFSWNIGALFHRLGSTITALDIPAYDNGQYRFEEGLAWGSWYGNRFATQVEDIANQTDFQPQDYVLNDLGYIVRKASVETVMEAPILVRNENGTIAQTVIGEALPDFNINLSNNLTFKGLELYILWNWQKGGTVYNRTKQLLYRDLRHAEVSENGIAAGFYETLYNEGKPNQHFLEDATHWLLREAMISYTFNQPNLLNGSFERLQFSLIGRNLWASTNYTGFHPNVAQSNDFQVTPNDAFALPQRRMWTGSLRVVF